MMTRSKAVEPQTARSRGARTVNPAAKNVADVVDVKTSTQATLKLLSYTISHMLKQRGVYPEEAFLRTNLREGDQPVHVLSRDRLDPDRETEEDTVEHGITNMLSVLHDSFERITERKVTTLTIQLHDHLDIKVVHEEWHFDIKYKESSSTVTATPTEPAQSRVMFGTPTSPELSRDGVIDVVLTAIRKLDSRLKQLRPFDFAHGDQNVWLGVLLQITSNEMEEAPAGFTELTSRREAGDVHQPARLLIGQFSFPFHDVTIKVKTNRYQQ